MIKDRSIQVKEGGVRLDAALLHAFPSTTRAFVKDAIAAGNVLIGAGAPSSPQKKAAKGLKLRGGEIVVVRALLEAEHNLVAPEPAPLSILFEDDALLAFDKSAGMPVQPLSCRETGTLMNAVAARLSFSSAWVWAVVARIHRRNCRAVSSSAWQSRAR